MVCKNGNKLSYSVFSLSTGKLTQDSKFPTDTLSFLGHSQSNIRLHNAAQVRAPLSLMRTMLRGVFAFTNHCKILKI